MPQLAHVDRLAFERAHHLEGGLHARQQGQHPRGHRRCGLGLGLCAHRLFDLLRRHLQRGDRRAKVVRQRGDVPLLRPALRLHITRGAVEGVEDGNRDREVEQPEGEQRRVGRPRRQQREEEAGRPDRAEDHAIERQARHQDDRREEGQRHRHDEVEAKGFKPDRRVRLDARAPRHEPLVLEPGAVDFQVGPDRRRRPERRYAEGPGASRL
mmetsp:Transcript_8985/g.28412  ORF Transcript_8985/g.28412 Transcript_8985/m.28412 type:complete len:211 (+) Transcript_8985:1654-2286(+)